MQIGSTNICLVRNDYFGPSCGESASFAYFQTSNHTKTGRWSGVTVFYIIECQVRHVTAVSHVNAVRHVTASRRMAAGRSVCSAAGWARRKLDSRNRDKPSPETRFIGLGYRLFFTSFRPMFSSVGFLSLSFKTKTISPPVRNLKFKKVSKHLNHYS